MKRHTSARRCLARREGLASPSGAIGSACSRHVMRGMRMPATWGRSRTIRVWRSFKWRSENILLIKGAIPGAKGDYVVIANPKISQGRQEITTPMKLKIQNINGDGQGELEVKFPLIENGKDPGRP